MQKSDVRVYLAGPMINCSEVQKTEWRRRLKKELKQMGYRVRDPTEAGARKGALAVIPDIEEADVVIANLWRESIGTILGIAQARRIGTPVILIDPNFIDSGVLREIVGRDCVVETLADAVIKLESKVAPDLLRVISLQKKDGTTVEFDRRKLHRSLRASFNNAKVDDAVLLSIVLRRITRNLYERSKSGDAVPTNVVKEIIFFELRALAAERKSPELQELTDALAEAWKKHEGKKDDRRVLDDLAADNDQLRAALSTVELERDNFKAQLHQLKKPVEIQASAEAESVSLTDKLIEVIGSGKVLCIHQVDCPSFRPKLLRAGLDTDGFDSFFEELALDGRQSNLNRDLKAYLKSYAYVLYAFTGLRHTSDSVGSAPNLISGSTSGAVTKSFLAEIDRMLTMIQDS